MALQDTSAGADPVTKARETAVTSAAPSVRITTSQVKITIGTSTTDAPPKTACVAVDTTGPSTATVTITYPMRLLGGIGNVTLTGKGTMRCNG